MPKTYTPAEKRKFARYRANHSVAETVEHFKISSSTLYGAVKEWGSASTRTKPPWQKGRGHKNRQKERISVGYDPETMALAPKRFKANDHSANSVLLDTITHLNRVITCVEARDWDGVDLHARLAKRTAQGKE